MNTHPNPALQELFDLFSEEDLIRFLKRSSMQKKYLAMAMLDSLLCAYALKRSDARAAEID
jgi:hypothetical protein